MQKKHTEKKDYSTAVFLSFFCPNQELRVDNNIKVNKEKKINYKKLEQIIKILKNK